MNKKDKPEEQKSSPRKNKKEGQVVKQTTILGEMFSGPVPPPKVVEAFEKVLPGSADHIFNMAEKEQTHQQKLDKLKIWLPFVEVSIWPNN